MIRVLLVDDHAVVRRGVRSYLVETADIEVVGECESADDALRLLRTGEVAPDVVLLDMVMPGMDGVGATAAIGEVAPGARVVILTSFGELERVHAALAKGASGYVLKDASAGDVEAAIRSAVRDEVFLDPVVGRRLAQQAVSPTTGIRALTAREKDVLRLVARGLNNQAVADELHISERTARTHVSNVLSKLQLTSRTQAALIAVREGLG